MPVTFSRLRRAYTWGLGEDLVVTTPFLGLSKPGTEHGSERVLSIEEISAVWRALDVLDAQADTPQEGVTERIIARRARERRANINAVRLLFLTGVRRAMVTGANRAEFESLDGATPLWTIPGGFSGRSKSGQAHVVPLSRLTERGVFRTLNIVVDFTRKCHAIEVDTSLSGWRLARVLGYPSDRKNYRSNPTHPCC